MIGKNLVVAMSLAGTLTATQPGCTREGWQLMGALAEVAIYVAVTAVVIAHHDAHYHNHYCGHRWVVYEERPVYYYEGRWEYYDHYQDTWYYYPDGVPGY